MKNYAKYIGLSVAALGVIGSVGVAYALYQNVPDPAIINIGYTVDDTADINYRIGTITKTGFNADNKVDPEHNVITIKAPLGAAPKAEKTLQPYVVGDLVVTVSGAAASIVTPTVEVKGFTEGKYGAVHYEHEINKSFTDGVATLSNLVVDVTGHTAEKQYAEIKLTYDLSTEEKMLAAQNKALSVKIDWKEEASFNYPYLVGEMTGWEVSEQYQYRMVPNLLADASWNETYVSGFQWYYHGFTNSTANAIQIKAKQGDTWSADPNCSVPGNSTKDLFWSGSGEANLYFPAEE